MGVPISVRQVETAKMISGTTLSRALFAQVSMVLERSMSPQACRKYQYMHENLQANRATESYLFHLGDGENRP